MAGLEWTTHVRKGQWNLAPSPSQACVTHVTCSRGRITKPRRASRNSPAGEHRCSPPQQQAWRVHKALASVTWILIAPDPVSYIGCLVHGARAGSAGSSGLNGHLYSVGRAFVNAISSRASGHGANHQPVGCDVVLKGVLCILRTQVGE